MYPESAAHFFLYILKKAIVVWTAGGGTDLTSDCIHAAGALLETNSVLRSWIYLSKQLYCMY